MQLWVLLARAQCVRQELCHSPVTFWLLHSYISRSLLIGRLVVLRKGRSYRLIALDACRTKTCKQVYSYHSESNERAGKVSVPRPIQSLVLQTDIISANRHTSDLASNASAPDLGLAGPCLLLLDRRSCIWRRIATRSRFRPQRAGICGGGRQGSSERQYLDFWRAHRCLQHSAMDQVVELITTVLTRRRTV